MDKVIVRLYGRNKNDNEQRCSLHIAEEELNKCAISDIFVDNRDIYFTDGWKEALFFNWGYACEECSKDVDSTKGYRSRKVLIKDVKGISAKEKALELKRDVLKALVKAQGKVYPKTDF